jgi:hypothetical protein
MRSRRSLMRRAGVGALLAAGLVLGSAALAQQGTGMRAVLGFSQGFSADTNRRLQTADPGRSLVSTTALSFGLRSETRTELFRLDSALNARAFDLPDEGRGLRLDNPGVSAAYRRDGARSGIALNASISRDRLRFRRPLEDFLVTVPVLDEEGLPVVDEAGEPVFEEIIVLPEDEDALIGQGRRLRASVSGRLDLGRGGPVLTTLTAGRTVLRYTGAPTRFDTTRDSLGVTTRLRLSPVTTGRVQLAFTRFDAEDAVRTQRDRIRLRFGVRHELSQVLVLDANFGPSWVITRLREPGTRSERRGLDGDLSLAYSLPNGTIGLSLAAITEQGGTRRSVSLSRSLDLPRGAFSGSIGLTRNVDGTTRTTGRLSYRHDLPNGSLSVQATQDFATTIEDETVAFTAVSVGYTHAINSVSGLSLSARYLARDEDRASFTATYRRALTADWNLNLGYRFDTVDQTAGRVRNHGVFLNVSRSFDFGIF